MLALVARGPVALLRFCTEVSIRNLAIPYLNL